jgi:hypothetical protein
MVRRRGQAAGTPRRGVVVLVGLVVAAGVLVLVRLTTVSGSPVEPAAHPAPATWVEASADPVARQRCETTVARARAAVAAAQPAYSHWAGHVRAQLDLDAGTATLEQVRARWAATKATGDADVADFAAAYSAYEAVRDGCAAPAVDAASATPPDPVLTTCRTELTAASDAVDAAKAVVDDWAAHVEMMKGKEHTDPQQYGKRWRDMVTAAPRNLGRFAQASLALRNYVDCPQPS